MLFQHGGTIAGDGNVLITSIQQIHNVINERRAADGYGRPRCIDGGNRAPVKVASPAPDEDGP